MPARIPTPPHGPGRAGGLARRLLVVGSLALVALPGCRDAGSAVQASALRQEALSHCDSVPHRGPDCRAEVEARFDACAAPYLDHRTDAAAFTACLGFSPGAPASPSGGEPLREGGGPPLGPARVVGRCEGDAVIARIAIEHARTDPWEGAAPRAVEGRTLYVAPGAITQAEVRALQLEERDGITFARLELSLEGSRALDAMTRTHVGDMLVMTMNHGVQAARIGSAIPGPELLVATKASLGELCRAP